MDNNRIPICALHYWTFIANIIDFFFINFANFDFGIHPLNKLIYLFYIPIYIVFFFFYLRKYNLEIRDSLRWGVSSNYGFVDRCWWVLTRSKQLSNRFNFRILIYLSLLINYQKERKKKIIIMRISNLIFSRGNIIIYSCEDICFVVNSNNVVHFYYKKET